MEGGRGIVPHFDDLLQFSILKNDCSTKSLLRRPKRRMWWAKVNEDVGGESEGGGLAMSQVHMFENQIQITTYYDDINRILFR